MSDPIEELIREIAVKHNIAVGRDDPILILQTINEKLMANTIKAQEVMLSEFKSEIEQTCQTWGSDTKDKANKIINSSLSAATAQMEQSMEKGAAAATDRITNGLKGALDRNQRILNKTQTVVSFGVAVCLLTLASVLIVAL